MLNFLQKKISRDALNQRSLHPWASCMGLRLLYPQRSSDRVIFFDPDKNSDLIRDNLESLEDHKDNAFIRITDRFYKQKMKRFYDMSVKTRVIQIGYSILCKIDVNLKDRNFLQTSKSALSLQSRDLLRHDRTSFPRALNMNNFKFSRDPTNIGIC
jgi:hypothetical protein